MELSYLIYTFLRAYDDNEVSAKVTRRVKKAGERTCCARNIQSADTKQGYCHEVWAGDFAAERTLRPHGHFSWNFEKNSNVVIKFSDNETRDCKPLMKYRNNKYPYSSYALYFFFLLGGGRLFEVGRLKTTIWGWVLIRGWALKNYFLGVGAYSRLGAYKLFLPSGWALIRGGRWFEIGHLIEWIRYLRLHTNSMPKV